MRRNVWLLGILLAIATPVWADTAYVSERAYLDIRADPHYESTVIHRLLAGSPVEALGQSGDFTRVRDAQGRTGWIETGALTLEAPARVRQEQLERELEAVRSELNQSQAQLTQAHKAMTEDSETAKALLTAQAALKRDAELFKAKLGEREAQLAQARAQLEEARSALEKESAKASKLTAELTAARLAAQNALPPPLSAATHPPDEEYARAAADPAVADRALRVVQGIDLRWLIVSFAMLLIGFGAGVLWLRERNRKRLGGMYLRV